MPRAGERETIPLDCKALYELAQRFSPVLHYHEQERFYPVLAESWLTHTTEAPWSTDTAHHLGDLKPDPFRRGMALCQMLVRQGHAGPLRTRVNVLAGQPVGGDRPLQLDDDDSDPYAIGRHDLRTATDDVFLDLAGWLPDKGLSTGDIERLYALFSELSGAINPNMDWTPIIGTADLPHAWIPQPVNPTTYCEARWAHDFTDASDKFGLRRFPDR